MRRSMAVAVVLGAAVAAPPAGAAQDHPPLEVGVPAPDFALPGATAAGLLPTPVGPADFAGKTIVLAFFYRARTKG